MHFIWSIFHSKMLRDHATIDNRQTKMPVKIYCMLLWNCHVKINGAKMFDINRVAQKHLKSCFSDCCFPKLTLLWDTHALPQEVSSRKNCPSESSDIGWFDRKTIGQKKKYTTVPTWIWTSTHQAFVMECRKTEETVSSLHSFIISVSILSVYHFCVFLNWYWVLSSLKNVFTLKQGSVVVEEMHHPSDRSI